ncbi:MAG TPA: ABC transporter substrate-binding protein [Burkholderiaceae bacterium]|nr:ABC transporter substrate-binding protein [Burkholderiaceae bacterium]
MSSLAMRAALALLVSCSGALIAGHAQAAGSLVYCTSANPEGFDVVEYETLATEDAAGTPIFDKLTAFKPGSTEVVPALAERWEVSPDGRTYTFHLRAGVQFHSTPWFKPTRPMNADDVLWSLLRIHDPQHPAHGAARNGYPYWAGMGMNGLVRSITKVNAMTVRIELARPEAAFVANLALSALASITSAEYGEQLLRVGHLDQLNTQPVGTGPFALKSYQKDSVIRYVSHKAHWRGAPALDTLIFAVTPDPAVRVQRLKAHECSVAFVGPGKAGELRGDPAVATVLTLPLATVYVAPNTQRPFLSDARLREALSIAVDRSGYVQSVYNGNGEAAGSFLPPGIWSHDASLRWQYDPERAMQLVKASGYDGRELQLWTVARNADLQRAVALLQADWARIGVKVSVRAMDLAELYKRTGQGEHDLALLNWYSDNGDPDNFFTPNLSCAAVAGGGNKARWCHVPLDTLLTTARSTSDTARRAQLYRQAQEMIFRQAGVIPIAHPVDPAGVNRQVQGVLFTPFGGVDFRNARMTVNP